MLIFILIQNIIILFVIFIFIINYTNKFDFFNKKMDYLDHKLNNLEKSFSSISNKIENNISNINKDLMKKNIKLIRIESIIDSIKFTIQNIISFPFKRKFNHNIVKGKSDKIEDIKNQA